MIAPWAVRTGGRTTGTVTLDRPAPAGGTVVRLDSPDDPDSRFVRVPETVTVPAGESSAAFQVIALPAQTEDQIETRHDIDAWLNGKRIRQSVHVRPPVKVVEISRADTIGGDGVAVYGGAPVMMAVHLNGTAETDLELRLTVVEGNALVPEKVVVPEEARVARFEITPGDAALPGGGVAVDGVLRLAAALDGATVASPAFSLRPGLASVTADPADGTPLAPSGKATVTVRLSGALRSSYISVRFDTDNLTAAPGPTAFFAGQSSLQISFSAPDPSRPSKLVLETAESSRTLSWPAP